MEVFKVVKDQNFDLDVWFEKLDVKSNDIILMKANKDIPSDMVHKVIDQFSDLVKNDERYQDVRMFILDSPDIDISKLTDMQLEEMGLMRISSKNKKKGGNSNATRV
jgi:hypothetical protein